MLQRLGGSRAIQHWNGAQDNMSVEPCSPSMACDMEEGCSKLSRKMQDKEETASGASWTAVTKGKEVWRLELDGEAENPEVTVLVNEAEGVSVNPEGESRHEQIRAKTSCKERGNGKKGLSNCAKRRLCGDSKSEKKKIRVESDETQDHGRKSLNLSRYEAEEISFVPSAISIPQRPMFWCDNRCSDKALSFWQFSVVIDDVRVLHGQSVSAVLQRTFGGKRSCTFEELAVEISRGEEGASWKTVENAGRKTSTCKKCGSTFPGKERKRNSF